MVRLDEGGTVMVREGVRVTVLVREKCGCGKEGGPGGWGCGGGVMWGLWVIGGVGGGVG